MTTHPRDNELLNNGDSGFQELSLSNDFERDSDVPSTNSSVSNSPKVTVKEFDDEGDDENQNDVAVEKEERDDDDNISELSCMSDLSNLSGEDWKPISNHIKWVQMQMEKGITPKEIIRQLTGESIADDIDDFTALRFIARILFSEPTTRTKLSNINLIEDIVTLIEKSSNIIILTGAGVSVSCGIPDFRSRNGIYARLSKDYPDLPDPQSMFDIHYFKRNPYPFFKFAKVSNCYPYQATVKVTNLLID